MSRLPRLSAVFTGRDTTYFDLFEAGAANAAKAAATLQEFLAEFPDRPELFAAIRQLEHDGDKITHDVIQHLNQTFVTPLEREDILDLVSVLDDVVDLIEEAADYLGLYRIEAPTAQAEELVRLLVAATSEIVKAMPNLRTFADLNKYTVEVNRLENEGDRVVREAIASLFDGGIDPMMVIRWKDIYERLEGALDACERVADILAGIVIKNA